MNERLKELEQQALGHPDLYSYDKARFIEIFAELIVQECIAQCNDGDSQYFIAKHFGVE